MENGTLHYNTISPFSMDIISPAQLTIAENLDGTEEFIEVIGQARFRVFILGVREKIDMRLFSLWFLGESGVHI